MDFEDRFLDELGRQECGRTSSGDQAYCENESKCLIDNSDDGVHCECNTNFNMQRGAHAGKYCEHKATFYCVLNPQTGIPMPNSKSFCTNNGSCKKMLLTDTPHEGCRCHDGFEGDFCEYSRKKSRVAGIVMACIAVGIVCIVALMVFRFYKKRKLERDLALTEDCVTAKLNDMDDHASHANDEEELNDSSSLIGDSDDRSEVETPIKPKDSDVPTSTEVEVEEFNDSTSLIGDGHNRSEVEIPIEQKDGNVYTTSQIEDKEIA